MQSKSQEGQILHSSSKFLCFDNKIGGLNSKGKGQVKQLPCMLTTIFWLTDLKKNIAIVSLCLEKPGMPKKPPIKLVAHFTLSQLLKSLITRQIIAITILSDFNFYNNVAKPQKQKPVFPWKLGFIFRRFYGFFVS